MNLPTASQTESAFPARYAAMRRAIVDCHSLQELKEMSNQAEALAAYFKAAHDKESLRKVHDIKLRAWRRIGEMLLQTKAVARASSLSMMVDAAIEACDIPDGMSVTEVRHALRIAQAPIEQFEAFVEEANGKLSQLVSLVDPKDRLRKSRRDAVAAEYTKDKRIVVGSESGLGIFEYLNKVDSVNKELLSEANKADEIENDVGITLQRKYRRAIRVFSFYIPLEAHEQLRNVAFSRRCTMHHIMREALDMWFSANGLPTVATLPAAADEEAA